MDCINFLMSISYENFINAIVKHFDENMALYNILKDTPTNDVQITGYPAGSSISFNVVFPSEKRALEMMENLEKPNRQYLSIYGSNFILQPVLGMDRCSIVVTMIRQF